MKRRTDTRLQDSFERGTLGERPTERSRPRQFQRRKSELPCWLEELHQVRRLFGWPGVAVCQSLSVFTWLTATGTPTIL